MRRRPPTQVPYIVYGFTGPNNFGKVTYPQSLLFCDKCHTKSTATARRRCVECERIGFDLRWLPYRGTPKTDSYNATTGYHLHLHHSTFAFTRPTARGVDCHRADGAGGSTADNHLQFYSTNSAARTPPAHRWPRRSARSFKNEIHQRDERRLNKAPTVKFRVSNPATGKAYDIVNDKFFTTSGASLNIQHSPGIRRRNHQREADGTEPGRRSDSTPPERRSGYTLQMQIKAIQAAAKTAGQATDGSLHHPVLHRCAGGHDEPDGCRWTAIRRALLRESRTGPRPSTRRRA